MNNEQLVARIKAGEDVAGNMLKLYNQNQGFLVIMARKYQGLAELEDLMQEGYIGLSDAVEHFDVERGVSFLHYAVFWIRHRMRRYVDNCSGTIRLPVYVKEEIYGYKRAVKEYCKQFGEEPSDFTLCRLLEVSQEKLQEIKKNAQMGQVQSLSEELGGGETDLTLEDTIPSAQDVEEDAISSADAAAMKRELWIAVDRLPGNLPKVIQRRYIDGWSLDKVSKVFGVTCNGVRQLQNKAMRALRQPGLSQKYRKYYEEYISAESYHHVGVESFMRTGLSEVELEVLGWIR